LFLEQGYGATTVEQVAGQIGATKRTVYVRFTDKAGLFHAVVKRVLDARRPDLRSIGVDRSVDERLVDMGLRVLGYGLDPDVVRLLRVVTAEAYRFPELNRMIEEQAAHGIGWAVGQMLEEEVRLGRLTLADVGLATRLLLSLLTGAPTKEAGRGGTPLSGAGRRQWVEGAVALFLDGARAGGRPVGDQAAFHHCHHSFCAITRKAVGRLVSRSTPNCKGCSTAESRIRPVLLRVPNNPAAVRPMVGIETSISCRTASPLSSTSLRRPDRLK
jgi:TetR/AcrR family transcriptional repressor of mexJK operon